MADQQSRASGKDQDQEKQRSFTSDKLEWMSCLSLDPRISPHAFEVGFQIAQHVSASSGVAVIADDTLSEYTATSRQHVLRSRKRLRETGWLNWRSTQTANVYTLSFSNINAMLDLRISNKDARNERRLKRRAVAPTSQHKASGVTPTSQQAVTPMSQQAVSPRSHIHLLSNTQELTPSKIPLAAGSMLKGETSADDFEGIPDFLLRKKMLEVA
jgi:hypothetical protein